MGWDIDELGRNYDAEKAKQMTPEELVEYKAECIEKKRAKHGLSANEYIAKKRAAQETERAAKAIEIANEAEEHAERAESNARLREKARAEMRAEVDALWEQKQQAKADADTAKADADTAKAEQKAAEAARDKAARVLTDMEPRIKAVGKRETDVKAREASVKKREESVAASERDIAVKQTQADAVLAAARRDAEAVGRRIEEEAERRADETEQKAAERAAAMLDEAEQLSTAEDATESFLRFARGQLPRGDYYALCELYDQWQAERQAGDNERARRTARLRSQVDDIQRRGRGGEGYSF